MPKSPLTPAQEEKVKRYEEGIAAALDGMQRKGKANPYTSCNGHMFTFLGKGGEVAIRLSKEERAAFLVKYPKGEVFSYNTLMKDYVAVNDEQFAGEEFIDLLKQSWAHVQTLKPKPTKK